MGGGIAGLATAFALQEMAGESGLSLTCTLIDADPHWGGKIVTHRVGELLIEAGPDSFLTQKPWALELCAKLGVSDRLMNTNESEKKAFVFSRGRLRELPEGLVVIVPSKLGPFLKSGLVSGPGMVRMALDLVLPAGQPAEDESLAAFFSRRLGREAFDRLIEPLMAGIYAGDGKQMSLRATFPRFHDLEQRHGSLIRGILAGRNAGRPATGPGTPTRSMFVTLRGGLGTLVDTLVAKVKAGGATLMAGQKVTTLRVQADSRGRQGYELRLASDAVLSVDAAVLATPAYVTADLVRSLSPDGADLLSRIPYASTATVSLAYERAAVGSSVTGFGFVVPRVEGRALLAATWSSLKWDHRAPASKVLVRCYLGGVGRETMLNGDDDTLVQVVRRELLSMAGVSAEPLYTEVNRWPLGMPQYTLGHLERLTKIEKALGEHEGLYVTGAGYRGIGIPDCIKDGTETARRVIRQLSTRTP